jgi:hypothetical protein
MDIDSLLMAHRFLYLFKVSKDCATIQSPLNMALLIAALVCLLGQTYVPSGTATAEGAVINATTGRPIPKASVDLRSPGFQFRTTTDAEGRFCFKNLLPAEYTFFVGRPGFTSVTVGLTGLPGLGTVIAADDHLSGILFKLRPQALIAGTVLAPDGKPLVTPKIDIWKVNVEGGKKVIRAIQFASIDADGSFVIGGLAPGRYYLGASEGSSKVFYPKRGHIFSGTTHRSNRGQTTARCTIRNRTSEFHHDLWNCTHSFAWFGC